mmetsp:Transcript_3967/g.8540  ORF Transcript_3967/g.8540 Transcript_3967/m.8540 type:complete len:286 (-) Transcript_3967:140-997(-)
MISPITTTRSLLLLAAVLPQSSSLLANYYSRAAASTITLSGVYLSSVSANASSNSNDNDNDNDTINDSNNNSNSMDYYRKDGVRMGFDPYAKGMAEKYGLQGSTDPDGFDPYADTVGPGIYGGRVKRDVDGTVVIGAQYQNHNHLPGPVYDDANGGGYSFMARAVHAGPEAVVAVLADHPDLREEISTGGARPLHICGMSQHGQHSTRALIDAGADVNAQDTYGYTALHRMASNNLPIGGEALVKHGGQDPNAKMEGADSTPIQIARRSRAIQFLMKMQELGHYD